MYRGGKSSYFCRTSPDRFPQNESSEFDPSQQKQQSRLSHQFITKEPDTKLMDEESVEGVSLVTDSQLVRQMQVLLGNYVGARICEHTFFPALWAVHLTMANIHQLESKPHYVIPKPTGPRFLLYVNSFGQMYLENMTQHFFHVDTNHAIQMIPADTVLDGVLTREKKSEGKLTFVIRDAVRCRGQDLTKLNVFQRLAFARENMMKPRWDAKMKQTISIENEAFDLDIVECLDIDLTHGDYLAEEFENEFKYPLRSLVFFPQNKDYVGGTNKGVLQWTEDENYNSVFRLVIQKRSHDPQTHTAGLHSVGSYEKEVYFAPIALTEEIKHLHGRIVDCRFVNGQWNVVRIRNDRPHPHSKLAVIVKMKMLKNPLTRQILRTFLDKSKGRSK